jgi:internalin A
MEINHTESTSLQTKQLHIMSELALQLIEKEKRERTGKLDLGYCGLTNFPKELFELEWLDELSFCNEYTDFEQNKLIISPNPGNRNYVRAVKIPRAFSCFTNLRTLRLGGNWRERWNLRNCSFLSTLTSLQTLNLCFNQINDIRFLEKLTALQSLDLSSNQISNISFLENLPALQSLDLSRNEISDISFLNNHTTVKCLDLSRNQISDIRSLENLIALLSLDLNRNQISDIHFLKRQTALKTLDLSENEISDISVLENLKDLKALDLSGNQISDISFLKNLTALQSLNLCRNQINDIRFLENLTELQSLFLSRNKINGNLFFEHLTALQTLDLSENKITNIRLCQNLIDLKYLNFHSNQIDDITYLLPILKKGMPLTVNYFEEGAIGLFGNPITNPPMNVVRKGRKAVLDWFEQLEMQGTENLYEARIVIVGESGAGKTTLYKKLKDENTLVPDPKQLSTHGININSERIFKHQNRTGIDVKTTIWDFGGQDTQNYLHQYFYAKDNLFVLVCDHRAEKYRFDYWFEVITRLCQDSRIVVVRNQNERVTASQSLNLKEYEERFPGIKLSSVDVDFKANDVRWKLLIHTIEVNLAAMERVNQVVPKTWKPIREEIHKLKEQKRCYIGLNEFQNICISAGLVEDNYQDQCLDYLHWLGYALHYEDPALANTIFIDPQWITTGLYEILKEENYKPESKGGFQKVIFIPFGKGKVITV